jgi:hypothetical protein
MKLSIRLVIAAAAVVAFVGARSLNAAPETWKGKISDAMCGADHKANGGTEAKDHDCAVKCAKGENYVFVNAADKKIYKIANPKMADIEKHAGHNIELTGELKNDSITVTKIAMPAAKGKG